MRLVKRNVNIDFMGKRRAALGLSALLMAAALVVLPLLGLNFGLDFTGGTEVEVRFSEAPEIAEVRESLESAGMADATVQAIRALRERTTDVVSLQEIHAASGAVPGSVVAGTGGGTADRKP